MRELGHPINIEGRVLMRPPCSPKLEISETKHSRPAAGGVQHSSLRREAN